MTPRAFRELPDVERVELEQFVFLQDLKEIDLAEKQAEAQKKAKDKAKRKADAAAARAKVKGRNKFA